MSTTRFVSIAALVVTTVASRVVTLAAQGVPPLSPGTRIRVTLNTMPPRTVVGVVDTLKNNVLHLRDLSQPAGGRDSLPLSAVSSLQVSRGERSHWLVGAGVGGLVGFAVGLAAAKGQSLESGFSTMGGVGLGGILVGAMVGAAIKSEKWESMPLTSLQVAPVSLNRVGITVSLSF